MWKLWTWELGLYVIKTFLSKLGFLEIWYKQEIDRTLFGNFETKNIWLSKARDICKYRKFKIMLIKFLYIHVGIWFKVLTYSII